MPLTSILIAGAGSNPGPPFSIDRPPLATNRISAFEKEIKDDFDMDVVLLEPRDEVCDRGERRDAGPLAAPDFRRRLVALLRLVEASRSGGQ